MPISMGLAGLAAAVGGTITGLINNKNQKQANKYNTDAQLSINEQNRQATIANNELARKWANEDWTRTNAWNSPQQQMQRLKEAGLNPHLIYGSGTATNIAQSPRSTNPEAPKASAPQMSPPQLNLPDYGQILAQFIDVQKVQAQTENLRIQKELLEQGKGINEYKIAGLDISNQSKQFKLGQDKRLADVNVLQANARLANTMESTRRISSDIDKIKTETAAIPVRLNNEKSRIEIQRAELQLQQAKTKVQVENIMADTAIKVYRLSDLAPLEKEAAIQRIENMKKTGQLLQIQMNLEQAGIYKSDPRFIRMFIQGAHNINDKIGVYGEKIPSLLFGE